MVDTQADVSSSLVLGRGIMQRACIQLSAPRLTVPAPALCFPTGAGSKAAAAADASAAAALKLDPADDPIWRDMEELSKELQLPATPPTE